jgi:hypothetical protein
VKDILELFGGARERFRALEIDCVEDKKPEEENDVVLFSGEITSEFIHTL